MLGIDPVFSTTFENDTLIIDMEPPSNRLATVFLSYSHKDELLRKELLVHLAVLQRAGMIESWHDRRIGPGQDWNQEVHKHLEKSHIILLLVSPDFLASDYIWNNELMRAMERDLSHEAVVIPVILRPCDWKRTPFARLQALPLHASPVTSWADRDAAWLDVTEGIHNAIAGLPDPT